MRPAEWLRELDRDAASGRLLQRCVAVVPGVVVAGLVVGAPTVVPYDRSSLFVLGPLLGLVVGGAVGAVLAARRCRALRR